MTSHRRVEKERADLIQTYRILDIIDIEDKEKLLGDEVKTLLLTLKSCLLMVVYVLFDMYE